LISEFYCNELVREFDISFIKFGYDIFIENLNDIRTLFGKYPQHLRKKYKCAIKDGLVFKEYKGYDPKIEERFNELVSEFHNYKKGMKFYLLPLDPFSYRDTKRWFYLEQNGKIIGFLMLNRLNSLKAWVINGKMVLDNNASKYSSEFMILNILDTIRNEDNSILYVGPIFVSEDLKIFRFLFIYNILVSLFVFILNNIFNMKYKQRYWKKFYPKRSPSYIAFNSRHLYYKNIISLLRFFHFLK
jgi:lysylphosphatidylglycerol synthetase-like protein (DUF2156 family)